MPNTQKTHTQRTTGSVIFFHLHLSPVGPPLFGAVSLPCLGCLRVLSVSPTTLKSPLAGAYTEPDTQATLSADRLKGPEFAQETHILSATAYLTNPPCLPFPMALKFCRPSQAPSSPPEPELEGKVLFH